MNNTRVPPFTPSRAHSTVSMQVSPASSLIEFDVVLGASKSGTVRLYNAGPSIVYVDIVGGQGDQTASYLTGMPIPPNVVEKFSANGTFIAAVTQAGEATLYATPGEGL